MTRYGIDTVDNISFKIEGLESVLSKMKNVSNDVKYKGGRFALRKAAQVVRNSARSKALLIDDPKSAAEIAKNIVERWSGKRFKQTGDLMFRVGVMGGAGGNKSSAALESLPGKDTRHWRHLEFGTQNTRAQPFMRRSMEENIGSATNEFVIQYGKALDRAIKKAGKI